MGGGWTGIWVQTGKTIEAPYPRWQKVQCLGGIIEEMNGSMTIVDKGWMRLKKANEKPHHAPPPLPIQTTDLPAERTTSLLSKSLDGSWVQFDDVIIQSAVRIDARDVSPGMVNLPRTEVRFTDGAKGQSIAWLYQPKGQGLKKNQRIKWLRGFVHAEQPGYYVLLSDKEEDILLA
jgi:hypothetical protein